MITTGLVSLALAAAPAYAAVAQSFSPAATTPLTASTNYTGASNSTLKNGPVVAGKSFDRFIQIWLENTDFATAQSSAVFQSLAAKGMLMDGYHSTTHPSEPNYIAASMGDFFGCHDDAFYHLPSNVSTIVDLLEAKNVSWASYQENMPYDGYTGFNYTEKNYLSGNGTYTYYVRKHNPFIIADSVANVSERALRVRNFNDFAADVNADTYPQWSFITPNMVNDAHDTTVDFVSDWLSYFLVPLLDNPNFNNNRTVILLTFDETETYTINNQVFTVALGGGLPTDLVGTTDSVYYTHYSALSTVEANWGLGNLGRQDTNKTVSNVYSWVAETVGYTNNGLTANSTDLPLTNLTGVAPGYLNTAKWISIAAPNASAVGAGGGAVFVAPSVNTALTAAAIAAPVNLTALGITNPATIDPGFDYSTGAEVIKPAATTATGSASAGAAATSKASSGEKTAVGGLLGGVLALAAALVL